MSHSESESDIWEYKPLKKTKRQATSPTSAADGSKRRKLAKQRASKKKSEKTSRGSRLSSEPKTATTLCTETESVQVTEVDGPLTKSSIASDSQSAEVHDGPSSEQHSQSRSYCPVCQMPFSILVVQTTQWHVAECLESPGETCKECPDGLQCSSSIPSHYKRYSHSLLAHSRALNATESASSILGHTPRFHLEQNMFNTDTIIYSKDSFVDSAVNLSTASSQSAFPAHGSRESHTPVRPNALQLLRSPGPEDIKKKKGWSPSTKGPRSHTSSREAKIRISTPLKARNISHDVQTGEVKEEPCTLADDYISYSPLSEVPAEAEGKQIKKKLFHSTALEDMNKKDDNSDSLILFNDSALSDDDLFADVLDQYETETSQGDPVVKESLYTCDQLESLESHEHLTSSSCTGLNDSPYQSSSPFSHSKDGHVVKDREDNPQLSSPQSLVLDRLRECISNTAQFDSLTSTCVDVKSESLNQEMSSTQTILATRKQTLSITPQKPQTRARTSGLKQTDIGVFFGLKPLKEKREEVSTPVEEKLLVSSVSGKSSGAAGRQNRQRKNTAASEVTRMREEAEEGAAQPTQAEGNRGARAWGRKRWNTTRATDGGEEEARRCPFYKKIPGTTFAVDAFQYGHIKGITAYFLTHFHSDHYGGLKKTSTFPIYCNKITGNLVKSKLHVDEQYVHILPMNEECVVDGVKVILLDANHCPGSAMLLLLLPDGQTVLHTGDFRAHPSMERYPELQGDKIQTLYLDTTYCSPEYAFPTQQEVITFAANTAFELVTLNPRTLIVCGTYSVGKEKVFLAISQVLGSKVYMSKDRYKTMCCLESEHIYKCITTDVKAAQIHVLPMMQLNFKNLKTYLSKFSGTYDQLVAFKPTGWTFTQEVGVDNIQPQIKDNISVYGIPYSEHSSYLELKRFVQWLRPLKIIPTVNVGSWSSRKAMNNCFSEWQAEVKALNAGPKSDHAKAPVQDSN